MVYVIRKRSIEKGGSVSFTQIRESLHKCLPLAAAHWLCCGFL
jgi:hypothetical protein